VERETTEVMNTRPGEGERRAMGGYHPQYLGAASLILTHLRDGSLQKIRLADPDAGRVDDFQLESLARIDAYQMKWEVYPGAFSFRDLLAIFPDLAEGWKALRKRYPSQRIVVHLITNRYPSVNDTLPAGATTPQPPHFAAFLEQAWFPSRNTPASPAESIPLSWQPAWMALRDASLLSSTEFADFVQDCELDLSYRLPIMHGQQERDGLHVREQLEHLYYFLIETIASPERIVELTRNQLLGRLGWSHLFELRHPHEFEVDDLRYVPIQATIDQLERALERLSGGYIGVFGPPGSGKSTCLTKTLLTREERVIRYYAYVPDRQDPNPQRGEAISFLHDMVLALERAGFRAGESLTTDDAFLLRQRFHHQLQQLHDDWKATERKTIFLVDGLDHIDREQSPQRSLLTELPIPERVPEGVYFVLGSQTDRLNDLPPQVGSAIRQPERRIEMDALGRASIIRITELVGLLDRLTAQQVEQVCLLSGGHPLALTYLLNHLLDAPDEQERQAILEATQPYTGSIEALYESHWAQIEPESETVHLLGLIARLRSLIDLHWVAEWTPDQSMRRFYRTAKHYFRQEDEHRWYFFHNSFRQFLITKTTASFTGAFDPVLDRQYHKELADHCADAPEDSPWSWEELYHRLKSGDQRSVLERATQAWFRQQFLAFRPIDAIRTDIQLALQVAAEMRDALATARMLLIGAEIEQRDFFLEDISFVHLLQPDEQRIPTIIAYMRDGNRLRANPTSALLTSVRLKGAGALKEAERIFELAEPLELLTPSQTFSDADAESVSSLLETWAMTAIHFRDLGTILQRIRQLHHLPIRSRQQPTADEIRSFQHRLMYVVGLALLSEERWEELATVNETLKAGQRANYGYWFWLQVQTCRQCFQRRDSARARQTLNEVLLKAQTLPLDAPARLALAEGIYRITGDEQQARQWLDKVPQPDLRVDIVSSQSGLEPFLQRFRLNRLLYALGNQQSVTEILPDSSDADHQEIVELERAVCLIAHLWAGAWRGQRLDAQALRETAIPLLRRFYRDPEQMLSLRQWHIIQGVRPDLYAMLVEAVAQYGQQAARQLYALFEYEWDRDETRAYWPAEVQRRILLACYKAGIEHEQITWRLSSLEQTMLAGQDIAGRVQVCYNQAEAWANVGEPENTVQLLRQMLFHSFGVGYRKDYQLNSWIAWLKQLHALEPEQAAARTMWFARAILTLEESTEGKASWLAADRLLAATFSWSPRRAVHLFHWFSDRGILYYEKALAALLDAALEVPSPPLPLIVSCLEEFLLPLAQEAAPYLITSLIEQLASRYGRESTLEMTRHFVTQVRRYAPPSTRPEWFRGVLRTLVGLQADSEEIGLVPSEGQPARMDDRSSYLLRLQDNSVLLVEEVCRRISTLADLRTLFEQEHAESLFDWVPVVSQLAGYLGSEEVLELARLFRGDIHRAQVLSLLSARMLALGEREHARSLAQEAMAIPQVFGWDRYYGEGTHLEALAVLVQVDPARARPLAYDTLLRDLLGGRWYPQNAVRNLDEILPLLTPQVPVREVWSEIEQHVSALFASASLFDGQADELSERVADDTAEAALTDLVLSHVNHPVGRLARAAQRLIGYALIERNPAVRERASILLGGSERDQECLLNILEAVSWREPGALAPFEGRLIKLAQSTNYGIRSTAQRLCRGLDLEPPPSPNAALPSVYQLALPPDIAGQFIDREMPSFEQRLLEVGDPFDLTRQFKYRLTQIAEAAGLPEESVFHRTVQLVRQLIEQDEALPYNEKQLRKRLEALALRFPYQKPAVVVVHQAMMHVVAELLDANLLSERDLRDLEPLLIVEDLSLLLIEPVVKPSYIPSIEYIGYEQGSYQAWLRQTMQQENLRCHNVPDDLIVLGAQTKLKRLDWGNPVEIHQEVVCPATTHFTKQDGSYPSYFYETVSRTARYKHLLIKTTPPIPLIIRHLPLGTPTPGEDWLALNPEVGRQLRWKQVSEGLFRWVDANGQTMVESIWWNDGDFSVSGHSGEQVGEGWLVLAKQDAFVQLRRRYEPLKRVAVLERSYQEDGRELRQAAALREMAL
jgi:hypothetical protein